MAKIVPLSNAAGAAAYFLRSKMIDPASAAKRARNAVKLNIEFDAKFDAKFENGAALTPPMGWSSWNLFRNKINENLILETAQAIKDSGLADCGYKYVNLDDCWQSSMRDENGRLQGDFANFPSGIKALVEKVNALGLKLGIYSSNGTLTCEDLPASLGNEEKDAETFAQWGLEYFKYDFCHNVPIPSRAPCIEAIAVCKTGSDKEKVYGSELAFLSGNARIVDDPQLSSGRYIDGLSGNSGAVEFVDVEAEEDGEYILTLCLRKKSNSNKYAEILVNGSDIYTVSVPATRAPSSDGRHQVRINLKKSKNTVKIFNPIGSKFDSAAKQYSNMGKALKKATAKVAQENGSPEKPIVYSICEWGLNLPWNWAPYSGNLWRTTPDIKPFWASVLGIYEINVNLYKHAGPGNWNDPDMLEVGNGSLSYYQWGRKDPIAPTQTIYKGPSDLGYGTVSTGATGYSDNVLYAISNPNKYICGLSLWGTNYWQKTSVSANVSLPWGDPKVTDSRQKSVYDPCPPGWRVPARDILNNCTYTFNNYTVADKGCRYLVLMDQIKAVFPTGDMLCDRNGGNDGRVALWFTNGSINGDSGIGDQNGNGRVVRCITDKPFD